MCGIAGAVSYRCPIEDEKNRFLKMQKVLEPRGPDACGAYFTENAALLHTRLAVIDLKNGAQPMQAIVNENRYTVVYNGELYNTEEIRNDLLACGHTFIGHSDTEVLLKAYIEWHEKCVDRFNGIFAFAVWDETQKSLFMARDRIGVKPLFYVLTDTHFLFASEIKALLASELVKPEVNLQGIAEVMLIGPGRTPGYGVFRNIAELPPAHYAYFTKNGLNITQYWALRDAPFTDSFEQTVEKVRYLVTDAITRQLVSDVPVCTFLSGGLDSSIISSVADRYFHARGEQLHTFTVGYKNNDKYFKASKFQPNSDSQFVGIMNDYLHAQNHLIEIDTKELVQALYAAVDARDLPGMADVDSSLLLFCREIKKQGTVALSGECADEIFGGYPWYRDKTIRMTDGFPWAQSTRYRKTFLQDDFARQIDAENYVYEKYADTVRRTDKIQGLTDTESRMKEMMKLNLEWFMQTLLDRKDRMSMACGLEVRVPFCDYRIAEYLYTVPWEYKDYKHYEKGLLREAVKDLLPEEILWRKKSPYPKTHNPAYLAAVRQELQKVLDNQNAPLFTIVKRDAVQQLMTADVREPWYGQLMTTPQTIAYFVQMNYWLEKYKIQIKM
ncbi:MAG: asparagine synthase (glutamine-hydrolyzing) [Candidatus Fimenecus sp.]